MAQARALIGSHRAYIERAHLIKVSTRWLWAREQCFSKRLHNMHTYSFHILRLPLFIFFSQFLLLFVELTRNRVPVGICSAAAGISACSDPTSFLPVPDSLPCFYFKFAQGNPCREKSHIAGRQQAAGRGRRRRSRYCTSVATDHSPLPERLCSDKLAPICISLVQIPAPRDSLGWKMNI